MRRRHRAPQLACSLLAACLQLACSLLAACLQLACSLLAACLQHALPVALARLTAALQSHRALPALPAASLQLLRSLACLRCLQPYSCIVAMKVPAALQLHRAKRAYSCIGQVLELAYDVTPALYVTAVVTEVGMIPPSSVPVIIREYHDNQQRIDSN